jgi:hypothetical protein
MSYRTENPNTVRASRLATPDLRPTEFKHVKSVVLQLTSMNNNEHFDQRLSTKLAFQRRHHVHTYGSFGCSSAQSTTLPSTQQCAPSIQQPDTYRR